MGHINANDFETFKILPLVQKLRSSFAEDSVEDTDYHKLVSDFPTQTDILKYLHRIGLGQPILNKKDYRVCNKKGTDHVDLFKAESYWPEFVNSKGNQLNWEMSYRNSKESFVLVYQNAKVVTYMSEFYSVN